MRFSNFPIGAIVAWWPLLAASDPHATAKVVQAKNACYEIRLPGRWHQKADGDYGYCIGYQWSLRREQYFYELRVADDKPGTILMGSHNEQLPDGREVSRAVLESPEHYAITLGKSAQVRRIPDADWASAHLLPSFASTPDPSYKDDPYSESNRQPYVYAGRNFAKSGSLWARESRIMPSQDSRFLALNSWDGKGRGATDWWPTPSFDNTGRYWVDIYEVATGQKLIAIEGKTHDVSGDHFVEGAQWSDNRYFLFPLSLTLNPFLLCDVEAAKKAAETSH